MTDVEQLVACVSCELYTAEKCAAEHAREKAEDRARRELAIIEQLDRDRVENPRRFTKMVNLLATLLAKDEQRQAAVQ